MAVRKSNNKRGNIQYVKDRKRADRQGSVVARRAVLIVILLVFAVLLCVGAVIGFFWAERALFSENPTFEIKTIEVTISGEKFSEQDIYEMGDIHEGMNLFALRFKDLRKRYDNDPTNGPDIATIEFERQLPDTLRIQVHERIPVARVDSEYPYSCLIDANGVLLEHRPGLKGMRRIVGLTGELVPGKKLQDEKVQVALEIVRLCNENFQWDKYIELLSIDVSPYDYVILNLKGNNAVKMPLYSLEPKLSLLASTISIRVMSGNPPVNCLGDLTPGGGDQLIFRER